MVSVFPPNYGLVSLFNVSYNTILDIIEHGHSDAFFNKCENLLNSYNDSIGIDEDEIPFVKRLNNRIKSYNKANNSNLQLKDELENYMLYLNNILKNKSDYFSSYVTKGRLLKKQNNDKYKNHKNSSISYTPFGVFANRELNSFNRSSKHLYFDIDLKMDLNQKRSIVRLFLEDEYIKASWLSFSGNGFAFIVESDWVTEIQMKKVYFKAIEYFTQKLIKFGFNVRVFDTQVCSLNRMNYISQNLINRKQTYKVFNFEDYSDGLYRQIHEYYKSNSTLKLPKRFITEDDVVVYEKTNIGIEITEKEDYIKFLNKVTKNLDFRGSDDYNTAIKEFINKIFVFQIDEDIIKDFLFDKIPLNDKTSKKYDSLINSYSRFSSYNTVSPSLYK